MVQADLHQSPCRNIGTATLGVNLGAGCYGQTLLTGLRLDYSPNYGGPNSCLGHYDRDPIFIWVIGKKDS